MDGKPAWPVFMRVWTKYAELGVDEAASADDVALGRRAWYE
jgi:hypothetical protein